ncbi:phage tail sheath family protein [Rhizobium sp. YJ-22]|uniref:phage tail sheath family protein n=1 Tax=Rhizobium sp. YJ-22 TaxID=3037556 RepID=UPI002412B224|nr:phage tail sheath family protein [Rhizobium sp. YJ-22]MDG3574752.1 phage tail sheath family protein [Rhizobium sp. YJ-22]
MVATTDFVGTRVFSNLNSNLAKIDTRDSTIAAMVMPAPLADNTAFPMDEPVSLSLDNSEQLAKLGAGMARDACDQLLQEGIVTDVAFVRVQHSTSTDANTKLEAEINAIAGSAGSKTGMYALLNAKSHIKLEPGSIMSPGYMAARPGDARNAAANAASIVADRIIDCLVVADTPSNSIEAAIEWAGDFKAALNVIALYPAGVYNFGAGNVTRPLSPSFVGRMIRRDKETGGPYKAFWNRPLQGVLGPSVPVEYTNGDISSDANRLAQAGVGTIIEGNLLWAPFTTATDPTTVGWRSIKRIRTRKAVDKALLAPFRKYLSDDVSPATVSLIYRSADQHFMDLVTMGALIDYELIWSKSMNPATLLEAGALRAKMTFAETPDLVDLQIYTEPQPEAYTLLGENIASALGQLGSANITVTA